MVGRIVCSKSGRDKGYFLVIVKCEDDFVYVCDGKERPLERPKRKNKKHLQFTSTVLTADSYQTNKHLKKALAVYRDTAKFKEEP
jgi:ribosomal protein L14E/L6E/L27E